MAQQTVAGSFVQEGDEAILAAVIAAATVWAGSKVRLYQSSFAPTPRSVGADFVAAEANFTGYPAGGVALTFSSVGLDSAGTPTVLSNRVYFQATDNVAPNTVGGVFVTEHTAGPPAVDVAVRYYPFTNPVLMTTALAFLGVVLGIQDPEGAGFAIVDS